MIPLDSIETLLADVDVADFGSGEVVALAHGADGGVRENFWPIIDVGSADHRFVGPHYPGTAGTPLARTPLDINSLADQVVAAGLRGGADRFPVVGLSLGSAVAITAAARHPDHVSALVLTVGVAHQDPQLQAFSSVWRALAAAAQWQPLGEHLLSGASSVDDLTAMSADDYRDAVAAVAATYPVGGASHAELAGRTDVTGLFDAITVPTLVAVGGQDRIVLPATARAFTRIPGATLIEYPDAGHIFNPDHAQRWAADVLRFLRER